MAGIPKAKAAGSKRIDPSNLDKVNRCDAVLFSFESIDRNDYFNLDGTCQNWAADLFDAMRKVSALSMADIRAGKSSGKQSPFRIHKHNNASPPCRVPDSISLDNMWQIRISRSKGGIHGIFVSFRHE